MKTAALWILLFVVVEPAHAQKVACDSTLNARSILAERTVVLAASSNERGKRVPRPLADDVIEAVAATFALPSNIRLQVYDGPARLATDSSEKGKREWAHPSLVATVRLVFDRSGALRTFSMIDRTFDIVLDSTFRAAIRAAVSDSSAMAARLSDAPADSVVLNIELRTLGAATPKEKKELNKLIADGTILMLPIARLALPHYPDAKPFRDIRVQRQTMMISPEEVREMVSGRLSVHAIVDTTGRVIAIEIPESTSPALEFRTLEMLRERRYIPATIAGCPVPARLVFSAGASMTPSKPATEYQYSLPRPPE